MRIRIILFNLTAVLFLSGMDAVAQSCDPVRYIDPIFEVTTTLGVEYQQARPYGSFFEQPYRLDIYQPTGDTMTYRPLMIFQFGGGFLIGDKLLPPAPAYCSYWAERGYVCVSINYRLGFSALSQGSAERAVYRGVQDLQASLRFLCEFRDTYGIDINNIIVSGNSAGAISTLHSTFMDESQVPASIAGFGIGLDSYDLGGLFDNGNDYWGDVEVLVDGVIANWGAILDTSYIGDDPEDMVPIILFHGSDDALVPYDTGQPFDSPFFPFMYGSVPMNARLDNTTIPHKFVPLYGAGHEPELLEGLQGSAYLDTVVWESQEFMYQHVLQPEILSFTGNQNPAVNSTELYTVTADEPIIHLCVSLNNGTVVATSLNEVEILWTTSGYDTLQIIAGNAILAYDTIRIPVFIDTTIGIYELSDVISANIYPNPFSDKTTIQLNGEIEKGSALILSDMLGQRIYSAPITSNSIIINSRETGKGFFLVYLENEAGNKPFLGKLIAQ
jgi:acetyl esterase/lipase